jgi:hypothetical protein
MCKRCEVESRKRAKRGTSELTYEVWMDMPMRKSYLDEVRKLGRGYTLQERHFIENLSVMNEMFSRLGRGT